MEVVVVVVVVVVAEEGVVDEMGALVVEVVEVRELAQPEALSLRL